MSRFARFLLGAAALLPCAAQASDAASLLLDLPCRTRAPDEGTGCTGLSGFVYTRVTFYDADPAAPLHAESRPQRYEDGTAHLLLDAGGDPALFATLYDASETSLLRVPGLRIRLERRKADGAFARITDVLYRPVAHALYARHSEDTPMLLDRIDEAEAGAIDAARTLAEGLVADEAAARAGEIARVERALAAVGPGTLPANCAAGQILVSNGAGGFGCGLMCSYPLSDCDGRLETGCETNVSAAVESCGGCGRACSGEGVVDPACVDGACAGACEPGRDDCNADLRADGCEVALATDAAHCGACGDACSSENLEVVTCEAGRCAGDCAPGFGDCNDDLRTDGCERVVADDPLNCGGCDVTCSDRNVEPRCDGAACVGACDLGYDDCNGDRQGDGCEVHLADDAAHCGACGNACPTPPGSVATCVAGVCGTQCSTGVDCNGNPADGCEATLNSLENCGGCGAACSTNHVFGGTCGLQCIGSICLPPFQCRGQCESGFANCDGNLRANGCEIALQSDPRNCGACGRSCGAAESCFQGQCMPILIRL